MFDSVFHLYFSIPPSLPFLFYLKPFTLPILSSLIHPTSIFHTLITILPFFYISIRLSLRADYELTLKLMAFLNE